MAIISFPLSASLLFFFLDDGADGTDFGRFSFAVAIRELIRFVFLGEGPSFADFFLHSLSSIEKWKKVRIHFISSTALVALLP